MKKLFSLLAAMLLPLMANAYDLEDKGIFFNVKGDGTLVVVGLDAGTTIADILSDVTIGGKTYQVTSIGERAFEGRSDITYLSIPWSVTSIGEYAFIDCGSNISVNIADPECWCQMELGNEHASPLSSAGKVLVHDIETTTIDIPETVTSIGKFTFYQCRKITSLNIPSSVKSIGSSAFEDCTGLTSLTLSEGLQSVGGSAFEGCTGLKSLIIPSTVNSISMNAFRNCKAIADVYCYAQTVPNTDDAAFDGTPTESATLHVPSSAVGAYKASWPWSDFKEIKSIGDSSGDDPKGRVTIDGLMYYLSGSEAEVATYGEYLEFNEFCKYCGTPYSGDIVIPSTVTYGGKSYAVTSIGNDAFNYCQDMTSISIPNTVTIIGESAFSNCKKLVSITIPKAVNSIGEYAFYRCSSINEMIVESGNKTYDSREGCNAIVETSTNKILYGCNSTTVPDGIVSIEDNAFTGCSGLEKMAIPNSVTYIGTSAFSDCSALATVTGIPNLSLGMFENCKSLTFIEIPDDITIIGQFAFRGCTGLTSVIIPDNVITIGSNSFTGCSNIKSITIGSGVTEIGSGAFELGWNNETLVDVYCKALNPPTAKNAFSKIEQTTLHVKEESIDAYKKEAPWTNFREIVPFGEDSQAFTIKGINYRIIDSSKLEVIGPKQNLKLANIPEYVDYNGKEYQVTKISNEAFKGNKSLTGVKIPQSIVFIGDYAFDGCSMLKTVFADYQEPIDISQNSFYGISARLIVAPGTKDKYLSGYGWKDAFESIEEYVEVINVHNPIAGSLSEIMPSTDKRFVKRINVSGEFNGTDLRILRSFVGCVDPCDRIYKDINVGFSRGMFSILDISNMKIVSGGHWYSHTHVDYTGIPDNEGLYTEDDCISPSAFLCGDFSEVYLPKSIKTIKDAFLKCDYLTDVYCYEDNVPNTDDNAFGDGTPTESATLHVPASAIEKYRNSWPWSDFKKIIPLDDVPAVETTYTDNGIVFAVMDEGYAVVKGLDTGVTIVDIPSFLTVDGKKYQVTSIGESAFEGRSDIEYLSIPHSIIHIGKYAFMDCGSNMTVNIDDPEAWCKMELGNEHSSPLSSAKKVQVYNVETDKIDIPEGVTSIGKFTFYQCRVMTSLNIPKSVTSISSSAFEDCTGLTALVLSEGLETIGGSAFEGCSGLQTLTIPSTVKTISVNAFRNCKGITDVYCYAENVPETDSDVFDATPTESATLHVPANAVEAYRSSWPWSDFKEIVAIGEEGPDAIMGVKHSDDGNTEYYNLTGRKVHQLQKGLNILRYKDGTMKKIIVK